MRVWIDSNGLRQGTMAGKCEHGNESSGSVKGRELLD
jgi:hypothetical protein